jgi:peptidoglycan/xylan/chitin deacetylase (PgdA/CDA1 family)
MNLRWPRILMYHSIAAPGDQDPNRTSTSPERFEAHMRSLARRNLQAVCMRDLHKAVSVGEARGLVGLTFDDAYDDFLYTAVPVMTKFNFSATLFAVAGMLGKTNVWRHARNPEPRKRLLTAEELREVLNYGMEVGAHSMTHTELLDLPTERLHQEVNESRRVLGKVLGSVVEGFAYPYGRSDDATVQAVRRAGYTYACGVHTPTDEDVHNLPRVPMSDKDGLLRFAAKLRAYPQYEKRVRTVAYPHYARLRSLLTDYERQAR